MSKILIIDDDHMVCDILASFFETMGHTAEQSHTGARGLDKANETSFDLVFLDVRLPDGNGLQRISDIRNTPSTPEVIIITGEGCADSANLAMKSGAWDYLQKPLSTEKVRLSVVRALQYRKEKIAALTARVLKRNNIVGTSPALQPCLEQVAKAGKSTISVLITGESGTGKELFARAIHENSPRADHPFVVMDCTTLPETLAESVLFGHAKGSFTGADADTNGLFNLADGGTLFLDEVGDLPHSIQSVFLRVLQEKKFRPIGKNSEVSSDFRLVAATNRDLDKMVQTGHFRSDLLFRLKSLTIHLPPLRDRLADLPDLTLHLLSRICRQNNIPVKDISPEFYANLMAYPWPGNIRELFHALESAVVTAMDVPTLYSIHLPMEIRTKLASACYEIDHSIRQENASIHHPPQSFPCLKELIESVEKKYLLDLINHTGGDISKICRVSGVSRSNIYMRLKKYGIARHF
ncbi:MAG: sigma-54-dependent transcriptional regulator [Desulfatirhabdiaceae bacterium]